MKCGRSAPSAAHSSSANWNPAVQLVEAGCSALIMLRNKPTLSLQGGRKSSRGKKNPTAPHQQAPSLPTAPGPAPLHFDPPSTRLQRWQRGATFVLHSPSPADAVPHRGDWKLCVGPSRWVWVSCALHKQRASWVLLPSCSPCAQRAPP